MNNTTIGLFAGLALGFAWAFGGFFAFLVVLVLGAVGLAVGRRLDGHHDIEALRDSRRGRGLR
ncbi:DUF2273 domain-containing protein [Amycolatopsis mongoliensis]|uniref:DUF2273 domain-containing protein n=1 Tax=Amycolatopsis mongoliensis TaxID=715475 RepID=A0A9Y2NDY8_9PSEU|nr:DUF2273 domain-containing protein [Amycolatopsis sp. 4-36]WIX98138.1 DUF2273 domain-containing protein [Amycolatopsis sp. 4-36]